MSIKLLVNTKIYREEFHMKNFIGSDHIFALIKSGSFSFESPSKSYIAEAGHGVLFKKNVLYHRKVIKPVTMYCFRYQSDTCLFDDEHILFSNKERISSTLEMLEQLDRGIYKDEFEYRKNLFFDIITQYILEKSSSHKSHITKDDIIENAIIYISQNLHKKIFLSEVGRNTSLSYIQFVRRFKSYTGMLPMDYIISLRLQKAKDLLNNTTLSVKDISTACGFESEYYFSNFFKKHTGTSPSSFRKMSM